MKKALLIFALIVPILAQAGNLRLPMIFADHMVLQQNKNIPIWGTTQPSEQVKVEFCNQTYSCSADDKGNWMLFMAPAKAGGPHLLAVSTSSESILIKDVYLGEVWLASGQSNMDWMMKLGIGSNTQTEIQEADYPQIRFFQVPKEPYIVSENNYKPVDWKICTPNNARDFSAVGYFFARSLYKELNIPVGIISSSWGATSIEAWMSADMLKTHEAYFKWFEDYNFDTTKWEKYVEQSRENDRMRDVIVNQADGGLKAKANMINYNDKSWGKVIAPIDMEKMSLNGYWGIVWLRNHFELANNNKLQDLTLVGDIDTQSIEFWLNGKKLEKKEGKKNEFNVPASLLKTKNVLAARMVVYWGSGRIGKQNPLTLSNEKDTLSIDPEWRFNSKLEPELPGWQNYYNTNTTLYNGMIYSIQPYAIQGVIWYQGENNVGQARRYRELLPMLINDWRIGFKQGYIPFITVQLANYMKKHLKPTQSQWAELREAQAMSLKLPNTGLVVTIDIGEENDIHPKNKLDVGKRLVNEALRLSYGQNRLSNMLFENMIVENEKVRVLFSNAGRKLVVKGETLNGFAVAGHDQKFYWASAKIDGEEVVVWSDEVRQPVAIRYAWADNPDANLYNTSDLPLIPFRTDDWEK